MELLILAAAMLVQAFGPLAAAAAGGLAALALGAAGLRSALRCRREGIRGKDARWVLAAFAVETAVALSFPGTLLGLACIGFALLQAVFMSFTLLQEKPMRAETVPAVLILAVLAGAGLYLSLQPRPRPPRKEPLAAVSPAPPDDGCTGRSPCPEGCYQGPSVCLSKDLCAQDIACAPSGYDPHLAGARPKSSLDLIEPASDGR